MRTKTPEEYLKEPYTYLVIRDDDGTFAVEVKEFEGCFSQGDTADDAMVNITEAATNWIEATLRAGKEIPPPVAANEASGKFALRLPKHIHQKVQQMAEDDAVSVNTFLVEAIAEKVGAIEYADRQMARLERRMAEQTAATLYTRPFPVARLTQQSASANTESVSEALSRHISVNITQINS